MKYFHLVWGALFRKKTRTTFTIISILAAFVLFGLLNAVRVAFTSGSNSLEGAERMVVASKFSIMQGLPESLGARIAAIPGVAGVGHENYFGGVYQDPKNMVFSFAVNDALLDISHDIVLTPAQRKAFADTRDGAIVGKALAARYHWKVGQQIPLKSQIYPRKNGSQTWPFTIVAIYSTAKDAPNGSDKMFFLHWKYFDEANLYGGHEVGWYVVKLANPKQADRIAHTIDALSANSDHETKTQTMNAFRASFAKALGNIGLIVEAIMAAVFFTLILLTGNTMAQAVRERIPELAVLKTIGFSNRSVLAMVLSESILLLVIGGIIGMLIATGVVPALAKGSGGMIPLQAVGATSWIEGIVLMIVIGILVGVLPALRGMRLKIVDALAGR